MDALNIGIFLFQYEPLESAWTDLVYGTMHEKSVGESIEGDFVSTI